VNTFNSEDFINVTLNEQFEEINDIYENEKITDELAEKD